MARTKRVESVHPGGGSQPIVLVRLKRRKKVSRRLRSLERTVDQLTSASNTFSSVYQSRHRESNRKKKDGWLRDLNDNLFRSLRKARKKIKLDKIIKI